MKIIVDRLVNMIYIVPMPQEIPNMDKAMERQRERLHPEPALDEREPANWCELTDYAWSQPDSAQLLLETFGELSDADILALLDCCVQRIIPDFGPSARFAALIERRYRDEANEQKWRES